MKKERQRWSAEEDNILRAYVRTYGPREWHLISQRMNTTLDRDAKSCLERWKNYLKPGIKKGSLTEEEQRLVIRLQGKHGNKWKKIAAEVPGRTAKRLGKWWEVYKEKQQRDLNKRRGIAGGVNHNNNNNSGSCNSGSKVCGGAVVDPIEERKYDTILENFAEKLVKERAAAAAVVPTFLMPGTSSSNGCVVTSTGFLHSETALPLPPHHHPPLPPPTMLPPWLSSNSNAAAASSSPTPPSCCRPPSPSVTLSLASSTIPPASPIPWLQHQHPPQSEQRTPDHHHHYHHHQNNSPLSLNTLSPHGSTIQMHHQPNNICSNNGGVGDHHNMMMLSAAAIPDLVECCRELEEGHRAWTAHRKEASWRLKRVELQLESEKACRRREKMDEIESKMKALREEQKVAMERIEAEYREQLAGLRRDAEAKEQKLAEQWAAKHLCLVKYLEQMGCSTRGHNP